MTSLTKDDILRGLHALDAKARAAGMIVEFAIYGGAALALGFDLRQSTKDVDVVVHGSPDFLRQAAREVAQEEGWPEGWMNDGVKGFVAANEQLELMAAFPGPQGGGLRIFTPRPEYIFAMKCLAMRLDGIDGAHDVSDIEALADIVGVANTEEALELVEAFYPREQIPAKTRFGLEEIMERVQARRTAGSGKRMAAKTAASGKARKASRPK